MRFRPIMMTTMAALLGGVPLMLGHGTGSELRQPLGYAMVGGLIVSQALTLFTTPVIYSISTASRTGCPARSAQAGEPKPRRPGRRTERSGLVRRRRSQPADTALRRATTHGRPVRSALQHHRDHGVEARGERGRRRLLVELSATGWRNRCVDVENQRHRAAAVGEREGARRHALLDDALDFRLHARAMLARARRSPWSRPTIKRSNKAGSVSSFWR